MAAWKENKQFYFSVEGETEWWYLEWLKEKINSEAQTKVSFVCSRKTPEKMMKSLRSLDFTKIKIAHIFDYESQEEAHTKNFEKILAQMRIAEREKGITYHLGYSNFAFELWIILHKIDFYKTLNNRNAYLKPINENYGEKFAGLSEYKEESNFKRILKKLTLDNVRDAIKRSEYIKQTNIRNGYVRHNCKEVTCKEGKCRANKCYFKENPSLSIGKIIKEIFEDCGLIR
ncbi:MAG: RloB family protein [Sporomusaceae bacterium]|jgi:hypothetical protein|nr:RloB family protein [Sporomusaceae bacterium]